jgi:hypothetical protein
MPSPQSEIARYLRTGEHDILFKTWPGNHVLDCCQRGTADLRRALVREVKVRTKRVAMAVSDALVELDCEGFARKKVAPMVRGLFPIVEQQVLLDTLARSLVFLTPDTIEAVLNKEDPGTAWDLANMYLLSCGAKLLADDAPRAVGMSVGTTCFVSMDYFRANHRFADFVVHEAAHIFHNCKRRTLGLPETRRREWLLEIDFKKRETFAYACEAYSRILELANGPQARRKLYQELESGPQLVNAPACAQDYLEAVRAAIAARNGWKRILHACAPPRARRTRSQDQPA